MAIVRRGEIRGVREGEGACWWERSLGTAGQSGRECSVEGKGRERKGGETRAVIQDSICSIVLRSFGKY